MQRIRPGPFGGAFDQILVEHPAFVPWLLLSATLLVLLIATVWALTRAPRHFPHGPVPGRGFEVVRRRDPPSLI